jgi:hypothetical protein
MTSTRRRALLEELRERVVRELILSVDHYLSQGPQKGEDEIAAALRLLVRSSECAQAADSIHELVSTPA